MLAHRLYFISAVGCWHLGRAVMKETDDQSTTQLALVLSQWVIQSNSVLALIYLGTKLAPCIILHCLTFYFILWLCYLMVCCFPIPFSKQNLKKCSQTLQKGLGWILHTLFAGLVQCCLQCPPAVFGTNLIYLQWAVNIFDTLRIVFHT